MIELIPPISGAYRLTFDCSNPTIREIYNGIIRKKDCLNRMPETVKNRNVTNIRTAFNIFSFFIVLKLVCIGTPQLEYPAVLNFY